MRFPERMTWFNYFLARIGPPNAAATADDQCVVLLKQNHSDLAHQVSGTAYSNPIA
jgi:hypothetical protein